jgi:hypothetical protein
MKSSRQKPTLDGPMVCAVKGPGKLDESWTDSDGKMRVTVEREGDSPPVTVLTGVVDQAALHSLLRRLYALGLPLVSVICLECSSENGS